jgi:hypothetical protein
MVIWCLAHSFRSTVLVSSSKNTKPSSSQMMYDQLDELNICTRGALRDITQWGFIAVEGIRIDYASSDLRRTSIEQAEISPGGIQKASES